ncbi:MAG: exonuclease domain-containing protein, partial [Pseudomonadota bacterium]
DGAYHYAIDALDRHFNTKPRSAATEFLKQSESLQLDEYYRGRPEYAVARYYESRGVRAFRTENELWVSLFGLLFWDLLFESTKTYSPFEGLPSQLIDETFYVRNNDVIEQRLQDLSESERSIRRILQSAIQHHGAQTGVFRWRTRTINAIQALIAHASPVAIGAVLRRMSQSFSAYTKGYPDLMLIEDGKVAFVEVKTPGDQLRSHQLRQIIALNEVGFPTSVVKVEWVPNPQQAYVVVDVETTGGRASAHRVTEIGAVKIVNGKTVDQFSTLINPERSIPAKITRLTGIRDDMVASAPRFSDIATEFAAFLDGSVFCAHNVNFDYGFVREEFARVGHRLRLPKRCTCASMRQKFPSLKSYALNALCREFDIPLKQHHRALCDAQAAAELLLLSLPEDGPTVGRRAS